MEAANLLGPEVFDNAAWTSTLLMLDEPRVIALLDGKFTYSFQFRRITQADWEKYFNGIYVSSRSEGGAQVNTTDVQTAAMDLFESTLSKATGYKNEMTSDFWKIPPRHAIPVSWMLRHVAASELVDDSPVDPELVETRIDALWSQTTPGPETTIFKGLVHRFSPPTAEHKKRVLRGAAMSKIVGGARKGTTIYSNRSNVLVSVYDQLIQSVDGYGAQGRPLQSVEEIRREMDAYHKVEAVAQLFRGPEEQPQASSEVAA